MRPRILFITGTDTGVGKTLLTSLLLAHLRSRGIRALALKPFCSGSRSDALLLRSLIDHELTLDEINPFYFPEPVAPLVAARKNRRHITLGQVLSHISRITHHASRIAPDRSRAPTFPRSTLLIEGAGGLLSPLAHDCTALDIIRRLNCEVVVVAANKLGTLNHTLLTIRSLQAHLPSPISHLPSATGHPCSTRVVLMNCRSLDPSATSNPRLLSELLAPIPVLTLPFLTSCRSSKAIRAHAQALKQRLNRLLEKV